MSKIKEMFNLMPWMFNSTRAKGYNWQIQLKLTGPMTEGITFNAICNIPVISPP